MDDLCMDSKAHFGDSDSSRAGTRLKMSRFLQGKVLASFALSSLCINGEPAPKRMQVMV